MKSGWLPIKILPCLTILTFPCLAFSAPPAEAAYEEASVSLHTLTAGSAEGKAKSQIQLLLAKALEKMELRQAAAVYYLKAAQSPFASHRFDSTGGQGRHARG